MTAGTLDSLQAKNSGLRPKRPKRKSNRGQGSGGRKPPGANRRQGEELGSADQVWLIPLASKRGNMERERYYSKVFLLVRYKSIMADRICGKVFHHPEFVLAKEKL